MIRIDARRVGAQMVDFEANGDWSACPFEHVSMRDIDPVVVALSAISVFVEVASPIPAASRKINDVQGLRRDFVATNYSDVFAFDVSVF